MENRFLGTIVEWEKARWYVDNSDEEFKDESEETSLFLLPEKYADADENDKLMRFGNPDKIGFWVCESAVKELKIGFMRISEIAYELYKMNWIAQHITREAELDTYRGYFKYRAYQLAHGEEVDTYEEWLLDIGFHGGQIYACYEEFCDGEYHDRDFVAYLFGNEEEFLKEYLEDIKDDYFEEVD